MPYAPEYLHLVIPDVRFEAYLYGRNSENEFAGVAGVRNSVDDQLTTGRDLCTRHNWPVIREFKDSDLSASRHAKKMRDDFEGLIATITTERAPKGVVRIAVAYEASRYYRDLGAYLRLREACMSANVLLCYNGQVYDLSRRDDRKATAQHAIDAEDEADAIQGRNKRTATIEAKAGKPHGRLPFGYAREYAFVGGRQRCIRQYEDPVRGPIVLKAFQHVDAGKSVLSLLRWMNSTPEAARPDGSRWSPSTVRILLTNRAYLGERHHLGTYVKAAWEPIRGMETPQGRAMFNRVVHKVTDPSRRKSRGTEVAHLLTHIALCGECPSEPVLVHGTRNQGGRRPILTCDERGDVSMTEEVVDAYVEEAMLAWFTKPEARAALVPGDDETEEKTQAAQRRINAYEEQLREASALAEEFDEGTGQFKLSAAALASLEQRLLPKLTAERKKLQDITGVSPLVLRLLEGDDPSIVWDGRSGAPGRPAVPGLTLEQKREVIRKVVTVRVSRAKKLGSNRPDLSRISLSFVGEPGFKG